MHGLFFLVLCGGYFLPTILAVQKQKHNALAIFAVNLLLGWTVIGWIVALVWAMADRPNPVGYQPSPGTYSTPGYAPPSYTPPPYTPPPQPAPSPAPGPQAHGAYCSHCGAPLKSGDKFCAGCGSSVPAA